MAKVLVVDDSPTDVRAMQDALEGAGHEVAVADTAGEGLESAKVTKPDLILMDVVFEGASGFQATRKLARDPATKDIPVIIISSKDQESDRVWGLRQGAVEYLVKPVDMQKLVETVSSVLRVKSTTERT